MNNLQGYHVKTTDQLKDAYAVRKAVFVKEQQIDLKIEIDEHETSSEHFVVYNNNQPIGAGRLRIFPDYAKVERICILKEARQRGVGTFLMNFIEQFAIQNEINKLSLSAQTEATPFYENLVIK